MRVVGARAHQAPMRPEQRHIVLDIPGRSGGEEIVLSAGEAALLMFAIAHALEEAERIARESQSRAKPLFRRP